MAREVEEGLLETLSFVGRDKFGYCHQLTSERVQRAGSVGVVPNKSLVQPREAGESGGEVVHLASLGHNLLLGSVLPLLQDRLLQVTV